MTNYFRFTPTSELSHLQTINTAYQAAGVKTPTRGPDFHSVLNTIGHPEAVVRHQIRDGLDTIKTNKQLADWYQKTITAVTEAIAAQRLRDEFINQYQAVQKSRGTNYATQAVEDLQKPFQEFTDKFAKTAKQLPEGKHALDSEAALAIDAGSHLKAAREALTKLSAFTGITLRKVSLGNVRRELANLAQIVNFPTATQEVVEGVGRQARNSAQLKDTYTIRQVDKDLQRQGIDLTLIDIARGTYDGVTFELADNAEHKTRVENLHTAFTRKIYDQSPSTLARLGKASHMTMNW